MKKRMATKPPKLLTAVMAKTGMAVSSMTAPQA